MQDKPTTTQNEAQPLISFIIACYNLPADLVKACVGSITALTLSRDQREIIVIDDGSDVSPLPELQEYLDDITYIRQRNQGLSAARNKGIDLCKGRYIQFVDGDDMLNTTVYELCLDLARFKNPDMVLFELSDKQETVATTDFEGPMEGSTYMRHNNLRAAACGYLFKKDLLIDLRFTPNILHEDEEFTPQLMLRAEHLYTTEAKAYYYRQREASITTENDMKWVMRRLNDLQGVLFRMADSTDTLPIEEREALERRVCQLTMDYIYNIITLTHNYRYLEKCVEQLTEKGLFPLPDRNYTQKYQWFRRMTGSAWQRRLLCIILK